MTFTNKEIKRHIPCECPKPSCRCLSSNGATLYLCEAAEEPFYFVNCYACGHKWGVGQKGSPLDKFTNSNDVFTRTLKPVDSTIARFGFTPDNFFRSRCIKEETWEHYGVTCTEDDSKVSFPYYDATGSLVAAKVKINSDSYYWTGNPKEGRLFGRHLFKDSMRRYVTVCVGHEDALAAYEMMGSKWPAVSLKNGDSSAHTDLHRDDIDWLNEFDTIVLAFDGDEPGRKAAANVAKSFNVGKVKILQHGSSKAEKDPNAWLQAGRAEEWKSLWWKSPIYKPDNIILSSELLGNATESPPVPIAYYPFAGLNKSLWGIYPGQIITLTAGSGSGKTSVAKAFILNLFETLSKDVKFGNMILEESVKKAAFKYVSQSLGINIANPEIYKNTSKDQINKAELRLFGDNRFLFWDHFGSATIDKVCETARYFAHNCGAKFILLDHISIVVSSQENGDERKSLDAIMTRLRSLCEETGMTIFLISHLSGVDGTPLEEGGITTLSKLRGSRGVGQLSDAAIGFERNGQHEDIFMRNVSIVRVLKGRESGEQGPCCRVFWDKAKATFLELREDWKEHVEELKAEKLRLETESAPIMDETWG